MKLLRSALRAPLLVVLLAVAVAPVATVALMPVAMAQATGDSGGRSLLQVILVGTIVPILGSLFLSFTSWASKKAGDFFDARAKNEKNATIKTVFDHLGHLASIAVSEVSQTAVDALKAAAEDGKLTAEEGRAALTAAVKRTWQLLGAEARGLLTDLAGGSEANAMEHVVKPVVEAAVRAQKVASPNPSSKPKDAAIAARDAALAQARLGLQ